MNNFWNWVINMAIWEQATDALGLAENDSKEGRANQVSISPQEEPIKGLNSNDGYSEENSNG